jgi:CBS domain-containing protein
MTVGTVMTKNPLTIEAEASPRKASDLMRKEGIHHLPVVRGGGRLIGILTDRDLRHAALMPALARADALGCATPQGTARP